jgi:hypothetical protein
MIAYVGNAKSFEIKDDEELHNYVYTELKRSVPEAYYKVLVGGHIREVRSNDAVSFSQHLPLYKMRFLYNALVFLLSKTGINIYQATYLVSALAVFLGIWFMFFAFKPIVDELFLIILPFIAMVFGLVNVARYSTPDGLAFMMIAMIIYLLLKTHRAIFIALPMAVLVRTDLIIFVVFILIYLIFSRRQWLPETIVNLALCFISYFFVNIYFGNYGWANLITYVFIDRSTYPATLDAGISTIDYLRILNRGISELIINKQFLFYVSITALSFYLIYRNHRIIYHHIKLIRDIYIILLASFLYVIVHFMLYPKMLERFFAGQYILGAFVLFFLLSRGNQKYSHKSSS